MPGNNVKELHPYLMTPVLEGGAKKTTTIAAIINQLLSEGTISGAQAKAIEQLPQDRLRDLVDKKIEEKANHDAVFVNDFGNVLIELDKEEEGLDDLWIVLAGMEPGVSHEMLRAEPSNQQWDGLRLLLDNINAKFQTLQRAMTEPSQQVASQMPGVEASTQRDVDLSSGSAAISAAVKDMGNTSNEPLPPIPPSPKKGRRKTFLPQDKLRRRTIISPKRP